ncbi:MAG TPA: HAD-IC family P-type ATPase [Polyangiaceae bacterium LLY-WYZ-15_(1-7)]|nr:HAD-IC family P-type ATPase [Polyangiaceae bacterium LLY-WYZ-15_(1-7)]HJL09860.1 HAD-IC family P-type ATPase [Polyangiaceae bacterium LLY-WYZ-15_(1-7)]HJL24466.1 HAD-IC family P-type ATPase [Polyangiaceae bacterium LLY-WYZ-15_(1-7)]
MVKEASRASDGGAAPPGEANAPWHARPAEEALAEHGTDAERGLPPERVEALRARFGENALPEPPRPSALRRFLAQFRDPLVGTLLVAAVVAATVAITEPSDAPWLVRLGDTFAITLIVLLNALLGFWQERRAEAALDALGAMVGTAARVVRGGATQDVAARELVPGDLVELEAGDEVPADLRLVFTRDLAVEEAVLTGESVPVTKDADAALAPGAALGDRATLAFFGTKVTRGRGRGVVVATGAGTEVGRIGALLEGERDPTPLEQRLARLGRVILWICLGISAALFALGLLQGDHRWTHLLLTAVSLAVAAIPEGLPAITTITLALGMRRMAARGAIVRRLPAVETLGSATVICTDKTGTLTENAMTVRVVETADATYHVSGEGWDTTGAFREGDAELEALPDDLRRVVEAGLYANHARRGAEGWLGDPTEIALLVLGAKAGLERERLLGERTIERELPFDSDRKRMSVIPSAPPGEAPTAWVKGSLDVLLPRCVAVRRRDGVVPLDDATREAIGARAEAHAAQAHRLLALAEKPDPGDAPEDELVFLGFVAMLDPPRPEVADAVAECRAAGVRVVMITGDHRATAVAIAEDLGFFGEEDEALRGDEVEAMSDAELDAHVGRVAVFARASAEQKLRIVRALQRRHEVVAMTGDGVNDAPALRDADIGVAMGRDGTDVAREAAAMVLADDDFATIVAAVREGRAIFENVRKFIFFLASSNAGLVLTVIVASFFDWLPLTPLQLLWVNLVTNGLPALALGLEPPEPGQMARPPRPVSEGVLRRRELVGILGVGALMAAAALALFALPELAPALFPVAEQAAAEARTMAFTLLAFTPLFHAQSARSDHASIFTLGLFSNRWLWLAIATSATVHLLAVLVPPLHPVFHTTALTGAQWGLVLGLAALPVPVVELLKLVERARRR